MTTTDKKIKGISASIIILTFVMIFLPAQIAFPFIQKIIIAITGGISVLLQVYVLFITSDRTKKTQSYILLALSVLAIGLMVYVYGSK